MHRYVIKRILWLIPIVVLTSFLLFAVMELASGNAVIMAYPEATEEQLQELLHQYGYDRSVFYRYFDWLLGALHGDFGTSMLYKKPVAELYFQRLPATIKLAFAAIVVSHLISLPLGIFSAKHAGSIADNGSMVLSIVGLSMPNFWLGLLLIIAFSLNLKLFPSSGDNGFLSVILPAITIGTGHTALLTRTTRSSMIDVIRQDYLRTARAKGVPENKVINKHALKNALMPIINVSGGQLGGVLGGAVLTETIFAWPGVGRLTIDALNQRDTELLTGSIILTTIFGSILALLVDLAYAFVDPRVKAQYISGAQRRKKKNAA